MIGDLYASESNIIPKLQVECLMFPRLVGRNKRTADSDSLSQRKFIYQLFIEPWGTPHERLGGVRGGGAGDQKSSPITTARAR